MYYVVIDLEWNQYHNPMWTPTNRNGVIMHEEIIQIGAVKTDETMTPVDTFNAYVRLGGRRRLDRYVKRLTGIDERTLASGEDFPMAAEQFAAWIDGVDAIFSWGQDDRRVFLNNLAFHNLEAPACAWYDAQKIYASQRPQHGGMALKNIAQEVGIRVNLSLHNAMNDAVLTAVCMAGLDIEKGISEYNKPASMPQSGLPKPISSARTHRHDSQAAAWEEANASLMHCPKCMKTLSWLDDEKGDLEHWYRTAACPDHGNFIVRGEFLGAKYKTLKLSFYEDSEAIRAEIDKEFAPPPAKKRSRRRSRSKTAKDKVETLTGEDMLSKAIAFAAEKHKNQLLLPDTAPYIVHPMEVCAIVSQMSDDPALLSAAVLHDVIDMCEDLSSDDVRRQFGDHVCELIESVHGDLNEMSPEALMILLGDTLSGLRRIKRKAGAAGDAFWQDMGSEGKQALAQRFKDCEKAFTPLKAESAFQEYKKLVNALFKPKPKRKAAN